MSDVLLVGGGVIGLTLAWKLSEQGASVTLIEQGQIGREASWAGAGMLPPADLNMATSPLSRLRAISHPLWASWSAQLLEETGIDNGYRPCGALELRFDIGEVAPVEEALRQEGASYQKLQGAELQQFEPSLSSTVPVGLHLPEMSQVRNPRHLKSLIAACQKNGVRLVEGEPVVGFKKSGTQIEAVRTAGNVYKAEKYCLTTGAWSSILTKQLDWSVPVRPVRGQIVLLSKLPLPFKRILQVGNQYLVPRPDGRILIGATMEEVGFHKSNTTSGVTSLLDFATRLVPNLKEAHVEKNWSGLRPGSPEGVPFLGQAEEWSNLFYAFGHFRDGLQTSSGTAVLMSQLIQNQKPTFDLAPYSLQHVLH